MSYKGLCYISPYGWLGRITMVMGETEAKSNYEDGINRIGISAYRNASDATSISEAAETLENAKQERLSVSDMGEAWADRY